MTADNFLIPFFTGGIAKSIASFSLMPINVVRLRLQMRQFSKIEVEKMGLKIETNNRGEVHYGGARDVMWKIFKNEGI